MTLIMTTLFVMCGETWPGVVVGGVRAAQKTRQDEHLTARRRQSKNEGVCYICALWSKYSYGPFQISH